MDDKKNKKKYVIPEAELVDFAKDDIMTTSGNPEWWTDDDNQEEFPL